MKYFFANAAFLLTSLSLSATVRTVSNAPGSSAQFSTIQAAVDASVSGDTIYIHGSANVYPPFNLIDKRLTFIGPGKFPDKDIAMQATVSGDVFFRNTSAPGSPSGSEVQGIAFVGINFAHLPTGNELPVDSLRIIRCKFSANTSFSAGTNNTLVEGCSFLGPVNFNTSVQRGVSNVLFQNNVFVGVGCCMTSIVSGLNTNISNVHFNHNLFYSNVANPGLPAFNSSAFLTLSNNIFVKSNPGLGISNSTFTNNITFNCGSIGDTAWIRNGNAGTGNIPAQNPQLGDQASVDGGGYFDLMNLTIAAGPAKNAGADGKDIGLLFDPTGSLNWNNSRNSRIPRVTKMNIVNPTVAVGSTISINVEAKKSN